jgi:hypothetical protein
MCVRLCVLCLEVLVSTSVDTHIQFRTYIRLLMNDKLFINKPILKPQTTAIYPRIKRYVVKNLSVKYN